MIDVELESEEVDHHDSQMVSQMSDDDGDDNPQGMF